MADTTDVQRLRPLSHWSDLDEALEDTKVMTLPFAVAQARQWTGLRLSSRKSRIQSCFEVGRGLLWQSQINLIGQLLDKWFVRQIRHGSTLPETPLEHEPVIARLLFLFCLS